MKHPVVSFVVLNWNGLEDTLECLDSIRKQTIKEFEIIVVDNGSAAEQKTKLRQIADITLIDFPENTGFTGGQIAAYQKASGDYIALINNDAVIDTDWAREGLSFFESDEKVAAVGSKIYSWNEQKGEKPFLDKNPFLSYWIVNLKTGHTKPTTYGSAPVSVDSVSGSGVMISRRAIQKVGYFDNTFFAYYEETDLFARFKRVGYKVMYNPAMQIWHKSGQSTKSIPDFYLYHMHRNRFIFAVKNYDRPFLYAFLFFYAKEWLRALTRIAKHGTKTQREAVNLVKAGLWNTLHLPATFSKRISIQKLGPTYSQTLLADTAERVSVIIPCFNYAAFIQDAIESVLNQSFQAYEIIVINDGSTDDSLAKIQKYKAAAHVIDQKNQGVIQTKNIGLQHASGDWVVFLDADDVMDKDFLQKMYAVSRKTNADVVYSAMRLTGSESGVFWSRPFSRRSLRKGNYINNSALIRRSLLQSIGGYSKKMHFGYEDWELYVHLADVGAKFQYIREPLLLYRRHLSNSRDRIAQAKLAEAFVTLQKNHPRFFSRRNEMLDFLCSIPLFFFYRTPLQIVKDIRYSTIVYLDKLSEHFILLNKILGFGRLMSSGEFSKVLDKLKANWRRLWGKSAK
jgi:GT2 family glycosyltransferase